jgi:hypothetical protein
MKKQKCVIARPAPEFLPEFFPSSKLQPKPILVVMKVNGTAVKRLLMWCDERGARICLCSKTNRRGGFSW